jgi:hypothetical protein
MSATMNLTLYLGLGLTLTLLRLQQGQARTEACLAGLLWPIELLLTGIEAAALAIVPRLASARPRTGERAGTA